MAFHAGNLDTIIILVQKRVKPSRLKRVGGYSFVCEKIYVSELYISIVLQETVSNIY